MHNKLFFSHVSLIKLTNWNLVRGKWMSTIYVVRFWNVTTIWEDASPSIISDQSIFLIECLYDDLELSCWIQYLKQKSSVSQMVVTFQKQTTNKIAINHISTTIPFFNSLIWIKTKILFFDLFPFFLAFFPHSQKFFAIKK